MVATLWDDAELWDDSELWSEESIQSASCNRRVPTKCCSNFDPTTCFYCKFPDSISISGSTLPTTHATWGYPLIDGTYDWDLFAKVTGQCHFNYLVYNSISPNAYINIQVRTERFEAVLGVFTYEVRVFILYANSFNANQQTHRYLKVFDRCPVGSQLIPFVSTIDSWFTDPGSIAPTEVTVTFPSL